MLGGEGGGGGLGQPGRLYGYIRAWGGGGGGGGGEDSNSKTLFYKGCSLGLVKNLANNERETQDARRKSLFDWPVAFTKVVLIVANCTLAKCSEEHKK